MRTLILASLIWIVLALVIFVLLIVFKIRAPYGRHQRKGWGWTISNKAGWILMELPALVVFPALALIGPFGFGWHSYLLVALWLVHYVNRTLIYPLRTKTNGKRMPLIIVGSAFFFNVVNGLLNGLYLGYVVKPIPSFNLITVIGLLVFFTGMVINWHADSKLIALRQNSAGYSIPKGGLFNYISCPNHFGEIIEWLGFALIAWNLPAFSFAIWTFCNLVPRALNHHIWYKEQFQDYPESRKAVIPFLL